MREIKFRGKRINDKSGYDPKEEQWVYGSLMMDKYENDYVIFPFDDTEEDLVGVVVIPETIGQFTGLKDKNGKEIYEGDIVELIVIGGYKHKRYEIFYDTETAQWLMKNGEDVEGCEQFYGQLARVNLIVIGNIYDNPELLKGDN